MALISHLADRACQTTLKLLLPTVRALCRIFVVVLAKAARSRREIKSSVDNAYGDKKMSYSQTDSVFKAVKDKK
jgi:hypothetical protein